MLSNRRVCGLALLTVLLGGAGCSMGSLRAGEPLGTPIVRQAQPASVAGPFLYVGGWKLSKYALGSTEPLHVTSPPYVSQAYIALDSHGDLCLANGNITAPAISAYNARTLQLEGTRGGAGAGPVAANRAGYLYEASGAYVLVYATGCTHYVNAIGHCVCGPLVFDQSGNLYAGSGGVRIYAPTKKPDRMKFVRTIYDGVDVPVALAIGPSEELFVANSGNSSISVFASGGTKPIRRITKGIDSPNALAVDSKERLYVANDPYGLTGWVSVYAPGDTRPIRTLTYRNGAPSALAIDPSEKLYVAGYLAGHDAVEVYTPGGAKVLQRITKGVDYPTTLLIGSP
jgi:hypothetical protein